MKLCDFCELCNFSWIVGLDACCAKLHHHVISEGLFITEPAPSTSDEKPASEPMETDMPEPEPEPEVDASVEEVCVLSTLWVLHSSKIWNIW